MDTHTRNPVGRPKTKYYETLSARLTQQFVSEVRQYAADSGIPISQLVREGLEWRIHSPNISTQQTITPTHPAYDPTKFVLGKLCRQNHVFGTTRQSLLYLRDRRCRQCNLERKRRHRQKALC